MSTLFQRLLLVGALSALGCGDAASAEPGGPPAPPTAEVEVAEVVDGPLASRHVFLGHVRSVARAQLGAGASGELRDVRVREGDTVRRGDVLAIVDTTLARSALAQAEATRAQLAEELGQARRDAERLAAAGERVVAAVEVERARSRAETLTAQSRNVEATLAVARESLARHRIVAPFDAVVAARLVDSGDWVAAGTPVIELVGDRSVEVLVRIDPELALALEVGHPVELRRGDARAPARIAGVVRAVDPATRTAQLRVHAEDPPEWLLPGSVVDVVLEVERSTEGVLVPRDAVVVGAVESRVVKIVEGAAVPVPVRIVDRGRERVRVRAEGLVIGDRVAVRGNDRLFPGQPVRVVEPRAEAEAEGADD
ncbi:MAG: efflux RND transporter periplasmic adaptor subunit [Myxococcales bacterium]|nr:efflux RND transporter periplasmic adaptor subunit [Myxococcales bacterium]